MLKKMFNLVLGAAVLIGVLSAVSVKASAEDAEMKKYGLDAGVSAPDFEAQSYEGKAVRLSDIYKKGPVVLIFYRGAWCPYCNLHLKSFQEKLSEIKALGADVLAVSVDKPEFAEKTVAGDNLEFEVVTDPQADILKSYNLVFQVPADLIEKYKNEYKIDLELHSGRTDGVIAVPATFIIDRQGKIIFSYVNEDYKVRTQPDEVIGILKGMAE